MNARRLFLLDGIGLFLFAAGLIMQLYFVGSLDREKLDKSIQTLSAKVDAANRTLMKVRDRLEETNQPSGDERQRTPQEEEALAKAAIVLSIEGLKAVGDVLGSTLLDDMFTPFLIGFFSVADIMLIVCGLLLMMMSKASLYQALSALSLKVEGAPPK